MSADTAYTLRRMEPSDVDAVQHLWSTRFGGDPSTQENWIEAVLDPNHAALALVAASDAENAVVGFTILEIGSLAYTRRYLSLEALELEPPLASRNGIFHLSCVRPAWEKRGIGSTFYKRRLAHLTERNVSKAFGIAWNRPHTVDSCVLFEKYDFTCLTTVERYYTRFEDRPHCPDCDGPCTCTAALYARSIEGA